MLVGKRVLLRAHGNSLDDDWSVVKWRNDPKVKSFFFEEEPLSLNQHLEWVNKVIQDPNSRYYLIQIFDGEEVGIDIGTIGLSDIDWRNRVAEFGWFLIGELKYRSLGYGKEAIFLLLDYAFNHLNLNRIWLQTMTLNESASVIYRKMGFQGEGVLKEQKFKSGKYIDVYIYGLLRGDFNALREELTEELGL